MIKTRKIAILGTAPSWKQAPFDDKSWDIWVCNRSGFWLEKRWDVLFEIHRRFEADDPEDQRYLKEVAKSSKEVRSLIPLGGPGNTLIDRDRLFKEYGAIWFSSSLAYMAGCAFDEKPTDIGVYGIEMESREEYVVQFAGVRHFLDMAKSHGIKIHMPDRCLLLREPTAYPDRFETIQALTFENKAQRCSKLIREGEAYLDEIRDKRLRIIGRIETLTELNDSGEHKEELDKALKAHDKLRPVVKEWEAHVNRLKGQLLATQQYKRLFVWNALPPDFGDETDADTEDCGPIGGT